MKQFLLDLILPRFSKLDFVNITAYCFLGLIEFFSTPEYFNLLFNPSIVFTTTLFFGGYALLTYLFVFKKNKNETSPTKKYIFGEFSRDILFLLTSLLLILSVSTQVQLGYFSFSTNSIPETFFAIFSALVLVQTMALYFLLTAVWRAKNYFKSHDFDFEKEIEKRINPAEFSNKSLVFGIVLIIMLFLIVYSLGVHPLIALPLCLKIDQVASLIEKIPSTMQN